jgi:hypothetical protein
MTIVAILSVLKNYFSGVYLDKQLSEYLESKGKLTPEQEERHRKEFLDRKIRNRYY